MKKTIRLLSLLCLTILISSSAIQSSTSGKIAGMIADAKTGGELQGATVRVEGINIATQTDIDGEFYIINLPVGVYDVTVSMLGYGTMVIRDIRILMDLTTPVDIELTTSPIDLKNTVTVFAKRPLIQRDKTSSGTTVTRDDMVYLADLRNVSSVISNMSGVVVGGRGGLHVRGGRTGTINYYFNGFSIQDPFFSNLGIGIAPSALEELSLTSGGLSPEYGEALSGVVNAITREGSDEFHGRFRVFDGATHTYDVYSGEYGGLTRTNYHSVAVDLSGPMFSIDERPATFFTAFEYVVSGGNLPHNESKSFSSTGKAIIFPTNNIKLSLNGAYNKGEWQRYNHRDNNGYSYDFNLDGLGKAENEAYLFGIITDYNKSSNTVFSFSANRFMTRSKSAPEHLFDTHWRDWPGYSEDENGIYNGNIQDSNYQRDPDYYRWRFTSGNDYLPIYEERWSAYSGADFSILTQLDKYNQIKLGGNLRHYELRWDSRQFLNSKPYGETYSAFPWYGAAYLQDKIELNDLVVNIGARLDYLYSDADYWNDPVKHDYKIKSSHKVELSPRLGISHPISENSVLHFNYGYLFQAPQAYILYTNLKGNLNSGFPLFGNPDLKAEKSIYYEIGLTQLLSNDVRLQLTTYYKDISNMIGAKEVTDKLNVYTIYANTDYGSAKGLDLILESTGLKMLNWSLNYSYMVAKGNASEPEEWYYNYFTIPNPEDRLEIPTREYPLSYDQRHNLSAIVDFRIPHNEKVKFLGVQMPDAWGLNMLLHYGSGLAYTRSDKTGRPVGFLNNERMPYTLRFDTRFNKDIYLGGSNKFVTFYAEAVNLFNRKNVRRVYTSTGRADYDGYELLDINSATYDEEVVYHNLMQKDPQNYEPPRHLRVGLEFNF